MSDASIKRLENEDRIGAGAPGTAGVNPGSSHAGDDDDDDEGAGSGKPQKERRKIEIKFIQDKSRRHITFSKRKAGIMKKAYELSVLTGTQVLLLVVSETGLVYTFTTPKLQPLVTKSEGKNLIQACLNAPEEGLDDDQADKSDRESQELPGHSPIPHHPVNPAQAPPPPPQQPLIPAQQYQAAMAQHSLPTAAHLPHGIPYPSAAPHQGIPIHPQSYNDPSVYQQYFGSMANSGLPNQQHYQ